MKLGELSYFTQQQQQRAALQELQQQLTQAQSEYNAKTEQDRERRRTDEDHATKHAQQLAQQRRELQDLDRLIGKRNAQ